MGWLRVWPWWILTVALKVWAYEFLRRRWMCFCYQKNVMESSLKNTSYVSMYVFLCIYRTCNGKKWALRLWSKHSTVSYSQHVIHELCRISSIYIEFNKLSISNVSHCSIYITIGKQLFNKEQCTEHASRTATSCGIVCDFLRNRFESFVV